MRPPDELDWIDELRKEQDLGEKARSRREDFFEPSQSAIEAPSTTTPGTGGWLISRRPLPLHIRYHTVIVTERNYDEEYAHYPQLHYGFLILGASAILEQELNALLVEPLRPRANRLIAALVDAGHKGPAAGLEWWAGGKGRATLGTSSLLLLALRRARQRDASEAEEFLDGLFNDPQCELLFGKPASVCVDHIRERYRNPACHPEPEAPLFTREDYWAFARMTVGHRQFMNWEREGPENAPPASDRAILHHLLSGSRLLEKVA